MKRQEVWLGISVAIFAVVMAIFVVVVIRRYG